MNLVNHTNLSIIQPDKVISSKKRKTISLEINKNAEFILRKPHNANQQKVNDFLLLKQSWIAKTISKIKKNIDETKKYISKDQDLLMYFGYNLDIAKSADTKIPEFDLLNNKFIIPTDFDKLKLQAWLKNHSKEIILERVFYWSQIMSLKPSKFRITNAKTRWGSCSSRGTVSINLNLIKIEEVFLDYVIIHELSHLEHLNHSKLFWELVSRFCPNYKEIRNNLKKYGFLLD